MLGSGNSGSWMCAWTVAELMSLSYWDYPLSSSDEEPSQLSQVGGANSPMWKGAVLRCRTLSETLTAVGPRIQTWSSAAVLAGQYHGHGRQCGPLRLAWPWWELIPQTLTRPQVVAQTPGILMHFSDNRSHRH